MQAKVAILLTSLVLSGCAKGEPTEILQLKKVSCDWLGSYNSELTVSGREEKLKFLVQSLKNIATKTNETKYVFFIQSLKESFPSSPEDQGELYASVCVE